MPGVIKENVDITLEQRVLRIYGRADISVPEGVGPLYLEYQSGDYERSFTLSEAIDANGIEARVRNGVLHLKLPKAGTCQGAADRGAGPLTGSLIGRSRPRTSEACSPLAGQGPSLPHVDGNLMRPDALASSARRSRLLR